MSAGPSSLAGRHAPARRPVGPSASTYDFTYGGSSSQPLAISRSVLTAAGETRTIDTTYDGAGRVTQQDGFTFTRNGPARAVSGISDGTLAVTQSWDGAARITGRTDAVAPTSSCRSRR
ncbi:MAG: hypothetical protein QM679_07755 [Patulibacter sp.]